MIFSLRHNNDIPLKTLCLVKIHEPYAVLLTAVKDKLFFFQHRKLVFHHVHKLAASCKILLFPLFNKIDKI